SCAYSSTRGCVIGSVRTGSFQILFEAAVSYVIRFRGGGNFVSFFGQGRSGGRVISYTRPPMPKHQIGLLNDCRFLLSCSCFLLSVVGFVSTSWPPKQSSC
ncbi:unnamed protein product, partial [Ectocarpus sp. 13 AM-2016]